MKDTRNEHLHNQTWTIETSINVVENNMHIMRSENVVSDHAKTNRGLDVLLQVLQRVVVDVGQRNLSKVRSAEECRH